MAPPSLPDRTHPAGLVVVDSFVSLTEISEYASGVPDELKEARLHPRLPPEGKRAFCFYPMSKRRAAPGQNWFTLPFEERKDLMYAHGKSGRRFAGRVLQVVTGATGVDDWEWGVTLFGVHPDDLKEVVYTMRFDEASAIYAEFGPFLTGMVATVEGRAGPPRLVGGLRLPSGARACTTNRSDVTVSMSVDEAGGMVPYGSAEAKPAI